MSDTSIADPTTANVHEPVILVDLDGTLLRSDILWESLMVLMRKRPWSLFIMIYYAFRGRARFKEELAKRVIIEAETLPYCPEVLKGIREQRALGRKVILATATIESVASAVAKHLGEFDSVLATSGGVNRKGAAKLEAITALFGEQKFEYWGDSTADVPLFEAACQCVVVRPRSRVRKRIAMLKTPVRVIERPEKQVSTILSALRIRNWPKNLLVYLPIFFADSISLEALGVATIAFLIFSFTASASYLLTGLLDLPSDRKHPIKRHRPMASGALAIPAAIQLISLLYLISGIMSLVFLPWAFFCWLLCYVTLAVGRSLWLWFWPSINLVALVTLLIIRILAGSAAIKIWMPGWALLLSVVLIAIAVTIGQVRQRPLARR